MRIFDANISSLALSYFEENLLKIDFFEIANQALFTDFGIVNFFENQVEFESVKAAIGKTENDKNDLDRGEYGDFQTNEDLANSITFYLAAQGIGPQIVVEPTCGKGNFIVASLQNFKNIEYIFAVEIYKPYVWESKFNVIHFFLEKPPKADKKPTISIAHCSVFDFDFKKIAKEHALKNVLVVGNPPWVTNAKLGSLNSTNLPKKSNFKSHNGLDAMTGKGNFDIAESITLTLLNIFQTMEGNMALLVKNSVIKNIVFDQYKNKNRIALIEKHGIDSKKEFNVSVEASIFYCKFNEKPAFVCSEFDFYKSRCSLKNTEKKLNFGWINDKFVSNIETYMLTKSIDGECPFVWRQGLKHDCATVMELDRISEYNQTDSGFYINGLNEKIKLEDGLVYGILKSSDLKNKVINQTRKFTIVTQKKVGQDTQHIKSDYPQTYQYLIDHVTSFEARKSSIYNNKPSFSIFGIGEYSFQPYKIAISGLYKTFHFTLILPQNNKPVMLDDTCYLLGFDKIEFAVYSLILLNSNETMQFLRSITFPDAKRTFTKDVLMRIDLLALAKRIDESELMVQLEKLNQMYQLDLTLGAWGDFLRQMKPVNTGQLSMFS